LTRPDRDRKEVTTVMLASVLDHVVAADAEIPCRAEPELWFAESPADVELAKSLCRDCPVRLECLAGAQDRREPWGVWGGELFIAGNVVPRGRPRKSDVAA
jgi:WhiB family redox-sensing transcriptional regulator